MTTITPELRALFKEKFASADFDALIDYPYLVDHILSFVVEREALAEKRGREAVASDIHVKLDNIMRTTDEMDTAEKWQGRVWNLIDYVSTLLTQTSNTDL